MFCIWICILALKCILSCPKCWYICLLLSIDNPQSTDYFIVVQGCIIAQRIELFHIHLYSELSNWFNYKTSLSLCLSGIVRLVHFCAYPAELAKMARKANHCLLGQENVGVVKALPKQGSKAEPWQWGTPTDCKWALEKEHWARTNQPMTSKTRGGRGGWVGGWIPVFPPPLLPAYSTALLLRLWAI